MNYRFTLEPYKGVSTRHTCPNCHRKSCFAKYIDTEKQISFPDYVGRCNHEQKCGYNYTPKMYFDENPIAKERLIVVATDKTILQKRRELFLRCGLKLEQEKQQ